MNLRNLFLGMLACVLCFSLSGCKWTDDDDTGKTTPQASGYEITVYHDGVADPVVEAESYKVSDDKLEFELKVKDKSKGSQTAHASGTWVVKHRAWKAAASTKRYQVTLYSGDKVVGRWDAHGISTDSRSILVFPADGSEVLRVCGNVVVRGVSGGTKEAAKSRVALYDGEKSVYQIELSSYLEIGEHLQGEAADGSGTVFIWGNYKVENLTR